MKIDTCPKHKIKMKFALVLTGGCSCRDSEMCYCESSDVRGEFYCPGVNGKHCDHRSMDPELTDLKTIERWIISRRLK
jgi:hypothetical protein